MGIDASAFTYFITALLCLEGNIVNSSHGQPVIGKCWKVSLETDVVHADT